MDIGIFFGLLIWLWIGLVAADIVYLAVNLIRRTSVRRPLLFLLGLVVAILLIIVIGMTVDPLPPVS